MGYAVKECFYTLQGEGANTGRAAVFLRFTGCNLWSGRERDREKGAGGCSRWCDTDFVGTNGDGGGMFADAGSVAMRVAESWKGEGTRKFVVCTGGEPLLQLDERLVEALHGEGFEVAVETNGTIAVPKGIDWVCVSPKAGAELVVTRGDELKVVVPQEGIFLEKYETMGFERLYVQAMDGPEREKNMAIAVQWCMAHPRWRLSVQTHKFLGIR